MTPLAAILAHHRVCDEIHACVMDENRFLQQHQRPPGGELLQQKTALLKKLDASLAALRAIPAAASNDPETRRQLDRTRGRILQILQLDKENEQLLLRCSLTGGRARMDAATPASGMLQRIYARRA